MSDKLESELSLVLHEIEDSGKPLKMGHLSTLSDLDSASFTCFRETWSVIDSSRRRELIARLKEMSEDNIEFSFDRIFKLALSAPGDAVRQEAIKGLWEDNEPSLIRPLVQLLEHDPSPQVREAAALSLRRFTLMAENQQIRNDYRTELAQTLLNIFNNTEEEPAVRRRALEAVAPLSLPEITRAIWGAYRQDDPAFKSSALYAMGQNCDLLWLPTILLEMGNELPEIRYEASVAAGELGEPEAVPQLIDTLKSRDLELRLAAIIALGKIGGTEAKRALSLLRSDGSQAVRDAAEHALEEAECLDEPLSPQF